MKKTISLLLVSTCAALVAFAQNAAPKAAAPTAAAAKADPNAIALPLDKAVLKAPFVLKDGVLSQPDTTDVKGGGQAVFTFTITKAGDYMIDGLVDAKDDDSNSFFINIDAQPEEPLMIWDHEHTMGFELRTVCWRGTGDAAAPEIAPKIFKLTAGEHKLYLVGREAAALKSLTIRPAK
jgi:hypothetical protein